MILNLFKILFLNWINILRQILSILNVLIFRIYKELSTRILTLIWLTKFLIWSGMRLRILIKTWTWIIFQKVLTVAEIRTILLRKRLLIALALKLSLWVLALRMWILILKSLRRCQRFIYALNFFLSDLVMPLIILSLHFNLRFNLIIIK